LPNNHPPFQLRQELTPDAFIATCHRDDTKTINVEAESHLSFYCSVRYEDPTELNCLSKVKHRTYWVDG
jgi:hypothetical protein